MFVYQRVRETMRIYNNMFSSRTFFFVGFHHDDAAVIPCCSCRSSLSPSDLLRTDTDQPAKDLQESWFLTTLRPTQNNKKEHHRGSAIVQVLLGTTKKKRWTKTRRCFYIIFHCFPPARAAVRRVSRRKSRRLLRSWLMWPGRC